jgi:hypothetical protein
MYYKQLKDFFRQREQKAFWVFNYSNIAGLFGGLFVARFLAEQIPWLPGPLVIPLVMLGGLSLTWQRQGRETYRTLWLLGCYVFRRVFAPSSLLLHSVEYYRVEQTALRPFSVAGRLAYSGEDTARAVRRSMTRVSPTKAERNELPSGTTLLTAIQTTPNLVEEEG